jgi:hypothetical protein
MGFADYDPNSTASGLFGRGNNGAQPAPGYTNFQVSDAQKANLLAQQQMRDQMVRQQQPAPQQMQQQQRAMSPLMQQQMMRQQQPMFNPMQQMMMRQQQPMFNPMQQQFRPQQQQMMRQQPFQQQQMGGLQAALMQMMGRQNQPMMRTQMPQYGRSAQMNPLAFRPDITQAQESLSRVKPSVQKQEQDAQAARIAELEGQLAGYQTPTNDYGGGG